MSSQEANNKALSVEEIILKTDYGTSRARIADEVFGCIVEFSLYQLAQDVVDPNILDTVSFKGRVRFHVPPDDINGNGRCFVSDTMDSPTWLEVVELADLAAKFVGYSGRVSLVEAKELFVPSKINDIRLVFSA